MTKPKPVIVAGGGWAGLTTAVELARHDIPVILLESAKQLGGRARRVPFENNVKGNYTPLARNNSDNANNDKISVDNGQHLLIGAYDSTLTMLRTIGVTEETVLRREKLALNMRRARGRNVRINAGWLPAPLHIAWGLMFASGYSLQDRLSALRFCRALQKTDFAIASDMSCLELFRQYRQTDNVIKTLWEPLCVAALNTPIDSASAMVFLRTLREAFNHGRADSDLLFTRVDLGNLYPDHAMDYIEKHGGNVRLGRRIMDVLVDNQQPPNVRGVRLQDHEIACNHVVLATPHHVTRKLLAPHAPLAELTEQLTKFDNQPITTVYLQYPEHTTTNSNMLGLVDSLSQWVFDRRIYGQPGLMAVVISSTGPHTKMDNNELCATVENELATFFPHWPRAQHRMVIREKRATFDCVSDCNSFRPGNKTPLPGLWLAGDYTDTKLPPTLEGAVRSGKRCARAIIKAIHQSGAQ
ncbi:MAG: hydroxysqualene dehydroxylase HpnE [Gammaproteobacteria bacterium]